MDVWLPVLCFFLGLFFAYLIYSLLVCLTGEEEKLIVFKSKRLTKKERIENLEKYKSEIEFQICSINHQLFDINRKLREEGSKKR